MPVESIGAEMQERSGSEPVCSHCGRPMLPTAGGFFCTACGHIEQETMLHDRRLVPGPDHLRHDEKTPALGAPPLFESEFRLEPVRPSEVVKAPREEGPPLPGAFDATRVMQAARPPSVTPPPAAAPPPAPAPQIAVSPVGPAPREERPLPAAEAFFLPRCKKCDRPLELEEIADGLCRSCSGERATGEEALAASAEAGRGIAGLVAGELAALGALWAGAIVLVRAVMSNPDTWKVADLVRELGRAALVVFAFVAAISWCRAREWAAGAALGLGPAAAALAASMLRSGSLVGDLAAASAWILAGLAGGALALAAMAGSTVRASGHGAEDATELERIRRRLSGRTARGGRVRRARAVVGGALALALAGFAAWRSALAVAALSGYSPVRGDGAFWPVVQSAVGLSVAALAGLALALVLFIAPPPGRTHAGALAAAVLAGALPCWLELGMRAAEFLAHSAAGNPVIAAPRGLGEGWPLAPAAALGEILGVSALSDAFPGGVPLAGRGPGFWFVLGASLALGGALAAGVWSLAGRPCARGRALAGFALACVLAWGPSLALAALRGP